MERCVKYRSGKQRPLRTYLNAASQLRLRLAQRKTNAHHFSRQFWCGDRIGEMADDNTTYTMAGVASGASKTAQGTPTHLVTSNTGGDLAAYTFADIGLVTGADLSGFATKGDVSALQSQINNLARRDDKLTEGIAATVALAQPILRSGQHFGMTAGWGGYDNANAVGFSAAGVLADNLLRPGSGTLALYGGIGVGTGEGQAAGRARHVIRLVASRAHAAGPYHLWSLVHFRSKRLTRSDRSPTK